MQLLFSCKHTRYDATRYWTLFHLCRCSFQDTRTGWEQTPQASPETRAHEAVDEEVEGAVGEEGFIFCWCSRGRNIACLFRRVHSLTVKNIMFTAVLGWWRRSPACEKLWTTACRGENLLKCDQGNYMQRQHRKILRLAHTARLKVQKNKNEQEEPRDVENQKYGHSLERKIFHLEVWIYKKTSFLQILIHIKTFSWKFEFIWNLIHRKIFLEI